MAHLISQSENRFCYHHKSYEDDVSFSHLISSDGKWGNNPLVYVCIYIRNIILPRVRRVRWAAVCKRENVEDVRVTLHWRQHSARSWLCSSQERDFEAMAQLASGPAQHSTRIAIQTIQWKRDCSFRAALPIAAGWMNFSSTGTLDASTHWRFIQWKYQYEET